MTEKELMTGLYGEGDIFGHIAMLEEAEYTESAIAVEPLKLYAMNKADFFSFLVRLARVSKGRPYFYLDQWQNLELRSIDLHRLSERKRDF